MNGDNEEREHTEAGDGAADDEPRLWSRVKAGDAVARERLVRRYLPLARRVAAVYYRRRLHDEIEFDEYLQLATLGMMESLDRFEPSHGVRFTTFVGRRMHGVILDGLERMTEKQQQIAARQRVQRDRLASLVTSDRPSGRNAAQTGALFRYLADVGVGMALSLMLDGTGLLLRGEDEEQAGRCLAGDAAYYRRTELRLLRDKLLAQVEGLKPQARQVIRSHYVQSMSFDDIAEAMGLTKSRVSQIHREALLWLRNELKVERSSDLVC